MDVKKTKLNLVESYHLLNLRKLIAFVKFNTDDFLGTTYEKFHIKYLQASDDLKRFSQCNSFNSSGSFCQNSRRLHNLLCYKHILKSNPETHYNSDKQLFFQLFNESSYNCKKEHSDDFSDLTKLNDEDVLFTKRIANMIDNYSLLNLKHNCKKMFHFCRNVSFDKLNEIIEDKLSKYPFEFDKHTPEFNIISKQTEHNKTMCYAIKKNLTYCRNFNQGKRYCSHHSESRLGDIETDIDLVNNLLNEKKLKSKPITEVINFKNILRMNETITIKNFSIDRTTMKCIKM